MRENERERQTASLGKPKKERKEKQTAQHIQHVKGCKRRGDSSIIDYNHSSFLYYFFPPNWRDIILVSQERKYLDLTNFLSHSLQPNINKITFLSSIFYILYFTLTKRTLRVSIKFS